MIADGVAALDARAGTPFVERTAQERLDDARAIAGSDLFELVRSTAVWSPRTCRRRTTA
jgi:hypothetical protein